MAKRPPPGKCVHCLRDPVERTWDHVFPESWYPDTTPANLYKWQIPACISCNRIYDEMEQELLIKIGLCIEPESQESSGVVLKMLQSLDPSLARDERDRRARKAKRDKILSQVLTGDNIPNTGIYPCFEEKWGRPHQEQVAITISANSVRRLSEKIVRGIFYLEDHKFIEEPWSIDVYALHDRDAAPIISILDRFGREYAREPGIVRTGWSTPNPPSAVLSRSSPTSGAIPIGSLSVTSPRMWPRTAAPRQTPPASASGHRPSAPPMGRLNRTGRSSALMRYRMNRTGRSPAFMRYRNRSTSPLRRPSTEAAAGRLAPTPPIDPSLLQDHTPRPSQLPYPHRETEP